MYIHFTKKIIYRNLFSLSSEKIHIIDGREVNALKEYIFILKYNIKFIVKVNKVDKNLNALA